PTLKKKVDEDDAFYVRAVLGDIPMTYQLTEEGLLYLKQNGIEKDGEKFALEHLQTLVERNWAYTGKSGVDNRLDPAEAVDHTRDRPRALEEPGTVRGGTEKTSPGTIQPPPPPRPERWIMFRLEASDCGVLDAAVASFTKDLLAAGCTFVG